MQCYNPLAEVHTKNALRAPGRTGETICPWLQWITPSPSTFHSMAFASVFFFARRFSLRRRRFSSASCSILSLFRANRASKSVSSRNLSSSRFRFKYRRRSRTSSSVARFTSPDWPVATRCCLLFRCSTYWMLSLRPVSAADDFLRS